MDVNRWSKTAANQNFDWDCRKTLSGATVPMRWYVARWLYMSKASMTDEMVVEFMAARLLPNMFN